jgi:hypothetical protein
MRLKGAAFVKPVGKGIVISALEAVLAALQQNPS